MSTKIKQSRQKKYKAYRQDILIDLPVMVGELVKENALVRIINEVVEGIDLGELDKYYPGGGCPPYHPKMLIKVWLYGYCTAVYTSRKVAKKLREDLCFIWLSGGQRPCFKTLSEFRGKRMKDLIDGVFKQVLQYLVIEGYLDLNDLYVDGTKWEANANKHKVVWRKNTERYKKGVLDRVSGLLQKIEDLQRQEDELYGRRDLSGQMPSDQVQVVLSSEELSVRIKQVNEVVREQSDKKKQRQLKSVSGQLEKEKTKLIKYEEQEKRLDKASPRRNSYSKTDEDATALRMKNEELKPGYNIQITSTNQYIINGTVHPNASDSPTFKRHIDKLEERLAGLVSSDWHPDMTADAAYGSEENYELLEAKGITGYVKFPMWYKEQSGHLAGQKYRRENWVYDEKGDYFICPAQKQLGLREQTEKVTENGYTRQIRIYESEGCAGCPLFKECRGENADPNSNRTIWISRELEAHKEKARTLLSSEEGLKKRSQRGVDVETPFGDIKYNMGHRRFVLRGKEKVYVEFLLLALAHNLRKVYCEKTGIWAEYYAQRASRRKQKRKKRA